MMIKKSVLLLTASVLLGGCVNQEMLKEQIAKTLKENPQIVFDAMRENSMDVLAIVENGIDQRDKLKREAKFEAEIKNPFKPSLSPIRAFLGNPDAPVIIVEYTDFLCPYCSKGAKVVRDLVAANPEKYKLVFRNLPLHEESRELAAVFESLAMIDREMAFKFHDLAFEKQKALYNDKEGIVLGQILEEVGVDLEVLRDKLQSAEVQEYLLSDEKEARSFGMNATPTFLVNGVSVRGFLPADKFKSMVDLIVAKSPEAKADDGEACEDCLNKM